MADDKVETISVPFAKTKSGLKLQPGHKTVIVIEDGHGRKADKSGGSKPGDGGGK